MNLTASVNFWVSRRTCFNFQFSKISIWSWQIVFYKYYSSPINRNKLRPWFYSPNGCTFQSAWLTVTEIRTSSTDQIISYLLTRRSLRRVRMLNWIEVGEIWRHYWKESIMLVKTKKKFEKLSEIDLNCHLKWWKTHG